MLYILLGTEGRVASQQSEMCQHSELLAKLIADGLADSCSQVIHFVLTDTENEWNLL